jgi:hypothetical protein
MFEQKDVVLAHIWLGHDGSRFLDWSSFSVFQLFERFDQTHCEHQHGRALCEMRSIA